MQLSGLEVLGVLNLHRDYCNDDVGNTFVTEWTFKSVIKSAQRNRCGSISVHEGPGGGHKDNSSLNVCVEGKQAVMLLLRVVDDVDLKTFVESLEVGPVRAERLTWKDGVILKDGVIEARMSKRRKAHN